MVKLLLFMQRVQSSSCSKFQLSWVAIIWQWLYEILIQLSHGGNMESRLQARKMHTGTQKRVFGDT
jgi:hypothetical protein